MTAEAQTARIPLRDGGFAIIDAADEELVSGFVWYRLRNRNTTYAAADNPSGPPARLLMHRLILGITDPAVIVDHRFGDGLDNRRSVLRICTHKQNIRNQKKTRGTSVYRGVAWHKADRRWQARIGIDGRCLYIGNFDCEHTAARAYDKKAVELFGEFARLNFPLEAVQ